MGRRTPHLEEPEGEAACTVREGPGGGGAQEARQPWLREPLKEPWLGPPE